MVAKLPCYFGTLRQATRAVTALYDRHFESLPIRGTQFTILMALTSCPSSRIRDLEDMLVLDQTTLTRAMATLEKAGFVKVVDRPNGREKFWGLTRKGHDMIEKATPLWNAAQEELRERMGNRRTGQLHDDLYSLAAAFAP